MEINSKVSVPCNGCKFCCKGDAIILDERLGDDPSQYLTEPAPDYLVRAGALPVMLAHKPNGDCIYLGPKGCEIHDHQPYKCRMFDCRLMYVKLKRQRCDFIDHGIIDKNVFDRGKQLLKQYPVPEHIKDYKRQNSQAKRRGAA